jgi:NADH-quinone oxidoreductase subunit N
VWGLTGTTRVDGVAEVLLARIEPVTCRCRPGLAMGLALLTTGVAFKIAAVPFHYWTPDAYQGSPTPITGYLSVGPKVGAFALILRLFVEALGPLSDWWLPVIFVLATLTMTLGNLVALTQDNVKRMLAYSSIAHTGYMLVGLAAYAAGQLEGLEGLLFYGAAYAFMNLGAFAVVAALQKRPGVTSPRDVRRPRPARAAARDPHGPLPAVAHRDPADGRLLRQGIRHPRSGPGRRRLTLLAVIAVLNAAAAAFYYLRVVVYMFMREPATERPALQHGALMWGGLAVATVLTVLLGLFPTTLLGVVEEAARAIAASRLPPASRGRRSTTERPR